MKQEAEQGFAYLFENFKKLDESVEEESAAIYNILQIIENLSEIKPDVCDSLISNRVLLDFLFKSMKKPDLFSQISIYSSEILSILLISSDLCKSTFSSLFGFEPLLSLLAVCYFSLFPFPLFLLPLLSHFPLFPLFPFSFFLLFVIFPFPLSLPSFLLSLFSAFPLPSPPFFLLFVIFPSSPGYYFPLSLLSSSSMADGLDAPVPSLFPSL